MWSEKHNMIDQTDVQTRPWLYNPNVVELVESLRIAQIAIDELRAENVHLKELILSFIKEHKPL